MSRPVADSTAAFQDAINRSCEESRKISPSSSLVAISIKLEKGDYPLRAIEIPKNSSLTLLSKDRVRLLFVGKRNRPMFILGDNSTLVLKEKLEIYYNTNNMREVLRLMIKTTEKSRVEISKEVKVAFFSQKVE